MSDLHDRDPATGAGFTLIELVVVLAVLSILAGSLMPVVTAARDGERALLVELELERIAAALEAYYGDHGRFPARLDVPEFRDRYLEARVAFGGLVDDWSPTGAPYGYAGDADPDVVVVWSVGPDGVDDGGRREEVAVTVHGAVPGLRSTRERLRLIAAALEPFVAAGRTLSGDWAADRVALGLGEAFERDGFGVPFRSDADGVGVASAGPDRRFGTTDDLGL